MHYTHRYLGKRPRHLPCASRWHGGCPRPCVSRSSCLLPGTIRRFFEANFWPPMAQQKSCSINLKLLLEVQMISDFLPEGKHRGVLKLNTHLMNKWGASLTKKHIWDYSSAIPLHSWWSTAAFQHIPTLTSPNCKHMANTSRMHLQLDFNAKPWLQVWLTLYT